MQWAQTGTSALISSISYTSGATTTYFFPSVIYNPVMLFKRGPTKLPRTDASKGAKKSLPACTKISFLFFCDVLRFMSSRILSPFLVFPLLLIAHFNIFVNDIDDAFTNRFDCIWF